MPTDQRPATTLPDDESRAMDEARRKFLKQIAGLPLYVAPLVLAVSLAQGQPQFPSPPAPPP